MKHFIKIRDIPVIDLKKIISDAKKRKNRRKKMNTLDIDKGSPLKGKLLIQMFEKSSLRTRLSFYIAIKQLSGGALTLRPDELHLSKGSESLADTSKIISTFGNAFMIRTDSDKKLEEIKKYMTIPMINGLSPSSHPTQILSDIFTIEEIKKKPISKLQICWIGDPSNNVINSLIVASGGNIDVVMSDMSPNLTGVKEIDQPQSFHLADQALYFSQRVLRPGGTLIVKIFQGSGFDEFVLNLRRVFNAVKIKKPKASRSRSREMYVVATGFDDHGR